MVPHSLHPLAVMGTTELIPSFTTRFRSACFATRPISLIDRGRGSAQPVLVMPTIGASGTPTDSDIVIVPHEGSGG